MAYGGVRAALLRAIEERTDAIIAVYDRGLRDPDVRVSLDAATRLLDRYLGRPTAVTESQPPGTQAYVELRSTLASLGQGRVTSRVTFPNTGPGERAVAQEQSGIKTIL